ncbi:MAG: oligosaccharide flippase family protein [Erysipelotrichaceae bacterium]
MSNRKQNLIRGGLISSAGIFITKIIGVLYVIPFTALIGNNNMQFYSYAYDIYTYILNISIAGLPFAIATMVSAYVTKGDYRTTLLIKKLSFAIMCVLGFLGMSFVILFAMPLAKMVTPSGVTPQDLEITRNVMLIISLALFFVPVMSSYRGFYQGYKEMQMYAGNQVLEQISRVLFLLSFGAIAVFVFHADRIWAVYFAVLSTSVSAIIALIQIIRFDHKKMKGLRQLAKKQEGPAVAVQPLLRELIQIAIPFLLVSVLGEIYRMVDLVAMNKNLEVFGYTAEMSQLIFGMVKLSVAKLTSIPMILASGFSIAIVPYITEALTKKNYKQVRRSINEVLDSVLYLVLPMIAGLVLFAGPVYYVMYGANDLSLGSDLLRWYAFDGLVGTVAPVFTYLLMSLKRIKINLRNLGVGAILKIVLVTPLIQMFGYPGALLSTVIPTLVVILLGMYDLHKQYEVNWMVSLKRLVSMLIGILGMVLVGSALQALGLHVVDQNRLISIIELGIVGGASVLTYVVITAYLKLPQRIFHIDPMELLNQIKARFSR